MHILRTARSLLDLGIDAVEALLYAVFDFDRQADALWADRLADKEAEEEVTEPSGPSTLREAWERSFYENFRAPIDTAVIYGNSESSSVADPSPEATDEQPPRSVSNHGVERGGFQTSFPMFSSDELETIAWYLRKYRMFAARSEDLPAVDKVAWLLEDHAHAMK